jgi:hypothetical protein
MKTLILLLAAVLTSTALAGPKEVPRGSELRDQLFDLARPEVEDIAGQPVKFSGSMKQLNGWAFFQGQIVNSGGGAILVGESQSADTALLWRDSRNGWEVVRCVVGITDVAWASWPDEVGAPTELLFPE